MLIRLLPLLHSKLFPPHNQTSLLHPRNNPKGRPSDTILRKTKRTASYTTLRAKPIGWRHPGVCGNGRNAMSARLKGY